MKRTFLLIVVSVLLVTLGFAQTPAASGNTDQINIKGCLGGSEGNYTVAEDGTGKIFKITTSSADLKPHVGHEVTLIGSKTVAAENSVAITEVNMISEHCTAAAGVPAETTSTLPASPPVPAAPDATVTKPSESAIAPSAAAAAPDASASAPAETVITPPLPAAAPVATVATPSETLSAPATAVPAAAPDAIVSTPAKTASEPAAAAAVHRTQPSAQHLKAAATPAAADTPVAAAKAAEPVSTPVADKVVPVAPDVPSPETASTPAAPTKGAPKTSTSRSAAMLVSIVVVLLLGAGVPLFLRWRRRKLADETKGENLSFTNEAKTDPGKTDTTGGRKAA
jgi:hypothetical protein